MRKLLSICLISSSLVLAQCSTTQIQQIEAFLGQVQAATAQACKFVPTIDTIISFVNAGIGQVVGVVAAAICNSVPPPASARFQALPKMGSHYAGRAGVAHLRTSNGTLNNIPVNGWRI